MDDSAPEAVEYPVVLVAVLYHSKKGDVWGRVLESLRMLDYPKDRMVLLFVDNYSRDGAFELCSSWIRLEGHNYKSVIHVRAKGSPSRLRNIAFKIAMDLDAEYFSFIESDILVDRDFLRRALSVLRSMDAGREVVSVSAVWDVGFENLDWLEKRYSRWVRSGSRQSSGVSVGLACNTSACLFDFRKALDVGFFDEDVLFIEDLDWGRRATGKGYVCLFDSRVVLPHLRKYSLKELRKYFMRGALSEAKLFLKNGLAREALRGVVYWAGLALSIPLAIYSVYPMLAFLGAGFVVYSRRARGWGKLLLFPVSMPFRMSKSIALGLAMVYWLFKGYRGERVTVDVRDWEVVETAGLSGLGQVR
ncbi:MAG: glycosyltransferase [Candidatus Caldarchaeum sp.]